MPGGETRRIDFEVPGEPLAWARAGRGGGFTFTPAPQRNFMGAVRTICAAAMAGAGPIDGPVSMEVRAVYLWPKSWSAAKRARCRWKTSRPDGDNLYKLVADALNTVAYGDDAQVASHQVTKTYGERASLHVRIWELA